MAKVPPRLEKTLIHGCPGPLPDPALPEWADVGGRKLVKGPSNRWYQQQLIEWKPGEEPSQGGYYTSGHWRIPDEVKGGARAVEHWANKFGNPPLDATGSCCTAKPGDVLLRTCRCGPLVEGCRRFAVLIIDCPLPNRDSIARPGLLQLLNLF